MTCEQHAYHSRSDAITAMNSCSGWRRVRAPDLAADERRDRLWRPAPGRGACLPRLEPAREPRTHATGRPARPLAALERMGSTRSTRTRPKPGTRRRAARTSSSRPAPPAGRRLAFNLPVLDALAAEPKHRALYLYPTKALAQDQVRALDELRSSACEPAIYDGDTASERRWQIRKWANLILTNPDMLHVGVLPHHDRWGDVLSNLRFVVVDEAHVYRGVFGSHVANVLRRLRRLARVYGAEPQFLLASATIGTPASSPTRSLGLDFTVIGDDGAPQAERTVALWNPPLLDEELGQRASALAEASRLMADLVERGLRTLCFAKSRRAAELIHRSRPTGSATPREPSRPTAPATRRRSAARSSSGSSQGELLGVSATNALELGIDVGLLDAAISVGFPGTVASLRQQWGRAGRRGHGLAVLVASEDALDQYFMREPETLLGRRVEAAILDHENPRVLDGHVAAAAFEAPIDEARRRDPRRRSARARGRAPGARAHAGGLRLGGPRLPGRRASASARRARTSFTIVDDRDRLRARARRARARVLDRPRGRDLPPPRRELPRAGARPRRAQRARRALPRRLLHAGEEGDDDRDRGGAPHRAAARARARASAGSR